MRTILIVEDDHDTRASLREAFESHGYCVFSAPDGKEGLKILRGLVPPIAVLLDQNMPVMSGDEFLVAKVKDDRVAAIPVIVMSAVCDRTSRLGANEFVRKPLDLETLLRKVEGYFGKPPAGTGTAASGENPMTLGFPDNSLRRFLEFCQAEELQVVLRRA